LREKEKKKRGLERAEFIHQIYLLSLNGWTCANVSFLASTIIWLLAHCWSDQITFAQVHQHALLFTKT